MSKAIRLTLVGVLLLQVIYTGDRVWGQGQEKAAPAEDAAPGLLANEPETAAEHFEAALVMLRVSRPDLAQHYLKAMLDMQPDDATLLALREQHGTATFFKLSRDAALLPQSKELLDRLQQAAATQSQDPAYFDGLITQLQGSPRQRDAALDELKHFGADAVPEILTRLSSGAADGSHALLLHALVSFGPVAVDPLLGAIAAPDPRTRAIAAEALGWIGDETIVPRLWYPALGIDQPPQVQQAALQAIARIRYGDAHATDKLDPVGASDEVYRSAVQHFRGEYPWAVESNGTLFVWTWDDAQNRLVKSVTNPPAASMLMAEQLARQAMLMSPARDQFRALFLAAALAHSQYRAGWDQPLPEGLGTAHNLALFSGAELTELALGLAVEHGNAAAAVGAATALGSTATRNALRPRGDGPSPLIAALDFPNDRVQFAAAVAVLQLDPIESFPRSSRVVEILARSLRTDSVPRGVVIDPNTTRAVETASVLNSLGYKTTIALTGKEGFCEAAAHADVALAVLHPNTIRWELKQTIANLRADSRTAGIPIVIAAPEAARADMRLVLQRVPVSSFVATGGDSSYFQAQLQSVLAEVSAPPLTPQQQQERVQAAAGWLRFISQRGQTHVFDLTPAERALAEAASQPGLGQDAIIALGAISRPSVQQTLLSLVLAPAIEPDLREAAARQLAMHVQQHGRLLDDDAVRALADAWSNAAEPAIRTALSALLGTLGPTPEAVLEKLQAYPVPTIPQP